MAVIYKLTREDGLEYIGITNRLNGRLNNHKKSLRFSESRLVNHEILFEGPYDECERLEEMFIEKYNTFESGLNCTRRGKGRSECDGFNTLGFKFSEESRKKMSASAKARGPTNVGMKLDIAISLSLECFFANKYIPMAPPPCAMIDTDQIP